MYGHLVVKTYRYMEHLRVNLKETLEMGAKGSVKLLPKNLAELLIKKGQAELLKSVNKKAIKK